MIRFDDFLFSSVSLVAFLQDLSAEEANRRAGYLQHPVTFAGRGGSATGHRHIAVISMNRAGAERRANY